VAGPRPRNHPDFPLRGFVRCERCGRPLMGSWSKGRNGHYAYYHCQRQCRAVNISKATLKEPSSKSSHCCSHRLAICGWSRIESSVCGSSVGLRRRTGRRNSNGG
jgi:hypothetical protein